MCNLLSTDKSVRLPKEKDCGTGRRAGHGWPPHHWPPLHWPPLHWSPKSVINDRNLGVSLSQRKIKSSNVCVLRCLLDQRPCASICKCAMQQPREKQGSFQNISLRSLLSCGLNVKTVLVHLDAETTLPNVTLKSGDTIPTENSSSQSVESAQFRQPSITLATL